MSKRSGTRLFRWLLPMGLNPKRMQNCKSQDLVMPFKMRFYKAGRRGKTSIIPYLLKRNKFGHRHCEEAKGAVRGRNV